MKHLYMLLLFFPYFLFGDTKHYVNHVSFMSEISESAITEMCRRYDMHPSSEGGGGMHVIRGFSVGFDMCRPVTIKEARRMAVECEEIYLETINTFRKARPYFIEFPMPPERVKLTFFVNQPNSFEPRYDNSLSLFRVNIDKTGICKVSYDVQKSKEDGSTRIHEETFEEAQKIVHEERTQNPSLQKQLYKPSYANGKKEKKPPAAKGFFSKIWGLIHFTNSHETDQGKYPYIPLEKAEAESLDAFCDKIGKEDNLKFIRMGDFTDGSAEGRHYAFSFMGFDRIDLQQAQKIAQKMVPEILQELRVSPEVKTLRESNWAKKYSFATDPSKDIPLSVIALKIAFWDENTDRIMPPHIAQILFLDGKMQYFTCDPKTQKLILIHEEPLNQPLK